MVNEIMVLNGDNEVRITSVQLVDEINKFRRFELEITGEDTKHVKPIVHKNLMAKIKKELEVLKTLGLDNELNFKPVTYTDSKGETRPCYSLNRDGILQMLNSESTLVRYKTIERLNELEEECKALNTIIDNTTDENAKLKRNKFRFSTKRTKGTFANCDTLKLPELYKEFSAYIDTLSTETRLTRYASALKGINNMIETLSGDLIYVLPIAQKVQYDVKSDMETLRNRQNGGIKAYKTKQINDLKDIVEELTPVSKDEYIILNYHAWSVNRMYEYRDGATRRTYGYNKWLENFPVNEVPSKDYWVDVDFSKPIRVIVDFVVADERLDADNLTKSFIDKLFNNIYKIDDNIVTSRTATITGLCDEYKDGKIRFYIENIKQ